MHIQCYIYIYNYMYDYVKLCMYILSCGMIICFQVPFIHSFSREDCYRSSKVSDGFQYPRRSGWSYPVEVCRPCTPCKPHTATLVKAFIPLNR